MIHSLDAAMPEKERLGEFLDAEQIPVGELQVGNVVWMRGYDARESFPVAGFKDGACLRRAL